MKYKLSPIILIILLGNLPGRAEFDWKKAQGQYEENVRIAARYPFREFEKAAKSGDLATVKRLLDQGVPADLPLPWPENPSKAFHPVSERSTTPQPMTTWKSSVSC